MIKILFNSLLLVFLLASPVFALKAPKDTVLDKRIKILVYNPDDVFKFTGYYGYQANIEFGDGENVDTISLGDTIAWQIVPSGKRLFLKPMEPNATTNMTVITNKRMYYFELHAKEAEDINDPEMVFAVRFIYPDEGSTGGIQQYAKSNDIDMSNPEKYNFNYTMSGSDNISPLQIFDDGEFTYFKFRDKNTDIPAFFMVDPLGKESLVNYRVHKDFIVVERVTGQFTLRNGQEVACIFNESRPLKKK